MPKFSRTIFFWFALGVWFIAPSPGRADDDERDCERASVQVALTPLRASGVVGTATLCVGENGVRGQIAAANLALRPSSACA